MSANHTHLSAVWATGFRHSGLNDSAVIFLTNRTLGVALKQCEPIYAIRQCAAEQPSGGQFTVLLYTFMLLTAYAVINTLCPQKMRLA